MKNADSQDDLDPPGRIAELEQRVWELEERLRVDGEESRARLSEQRRLISIIDATADMVSTSTPEGVLSYLNRAGRRMTGIGEDASLEDVHIPDLHPPWAAERIFNEGIPAARRDGLWTDETALLTPGGDAIPVSQIIMDHVEEEGENHYLSTIIRDISELRHSQRETTELRVLLESIVDSMPSILVGVSADLRVTVWNRFAARATGVSAEAAVGAPLTEVFPRLADREGLIRVAIQTHRVVEEPKISTRDLGRVTFEDLTVYPLEGVEGAVIRLDDVTRRTMLEERLVQSEKMASLGSQAAGMAHEINNPLAGIIQSAQVAEHRLRPELEANRRAAKRRGTTVETVRDYLDERGLLGTIESVRESGLRAARIVQSMLDFSRKSGVDHAPANLARILEDTLALAANEYDLQRKYDFKKIEIHREYEPLAPVRCSAQELQQVFCNLLRNGAEAMLCGDSPVEEPRLTVRIRREGLMARVEIEDNGPGIPDELRNRIMEPFFTTKGVGEGTGLGLAVSYYIVKENHGGEMWVESSVDLGSRFVVRIPAADEGDRGAE